MFHPPALDPIVVLVAIAVAVLIFYYLIRWIRHSLGHLGLSPGEIAVIIWATLVGSLINIPLAPLDGGFLGINVGGAVVPILLSIYLIRKKGLPFNEVLVGVILVAAVSYVVTDYDPEIGVFAEFPWWLLPPFTAFLVAAFAYWHERPHSAALAYVSGTLGTLLGADIVRLPQIIANPPGMDPAGGVGILSIGGAGVFDMVFLAGILAVTMEAGLLARTREDLVTQWRHNPIDAEYDDWVRKKAKEAAENRRKYTELQKARKDDPRASVERRMKERPGVRRAPGAVAPSGGTAGQPQGERAARGGARARGSQYRPPYRSRYRPRYRSGSTARRERRYGRGSSRVGASRTDRPAPSSARGPPGPSRQVHAGKEPWRPLELQEEKEEGSKPRPSKPPAGPSSRRAPASHRARGLYR